MTANANQSVSSPHRVSVNAVSATVARRGVSLAFRDVHVRAGDKDILKTISGGVERGEMMAVMGPSGKIERELAPWDLLPFTHHFITYFI